MSSPTGIHRTPRALGLQIIALGVLLLGSAVPVWSTEHDAPTCRGRTATIVGTPGDDVLRGTSGDDVIVGLEGNDKIRGKDGDDVICGGDGDDFLDGGHGADVLDGERGSDTADYAGSPASVEVDLMRGSATGGLGADRLNSIENVTGSAFEDVLFGDDEDNRLRGRKGNDLLYGRGGDDSLHGDAGFDAVTYEGAPAAVLVSLPDRLARGGDGNDSLRSIEDVLGSRFDDFIEGNAASNVIEGGDGDDVIRGRAGDDRLGGGDGLDVTLGNAGVDACDAEASTGCEPPDPGDSKNCSDFITQRHAQAWFTTFFRAYGDVALLDSDGNGVACESLPG